MLTVPECVLAALEGAGSGNRNDTLFGAVCAANHLNLNVTQQELMDTADELNKKLQTPLEDNEVKSTVTSVLRRQYPFGCSTFKDECPGKRKCTLFQHHRKPVDFTSVSFMDNRYFMSFWKKGGYYIYNIYEQDRNNRVKPLLTDYKISDKPDDIKHNSQFRVKLRNLLRKDYSDHKAEQVEMDILLELRDLVDDYLDVEDSFREMARQEEAEKTFEKVEQGRKNLNRMLHPILEIGSIIDWMVAGERTNVLFGFLCFVHEVVFGDPINFIAVGPSGGGKTAVVKAALSLIPQEFIRSEKKPSVASMFRRSEDDPYYYDNRIVYYGDLGGKMDMEDSEQVRNIIKELNSEGYANKPVTERQGDGKYYTRDIVLYGQPALTYTTVHENEVDDQEASRGFIISPRTDNNRMVNAMDEILALNGRTKKIYDLIIAREIQAIRNTVYHLRNLKDIKIINPYLPVLRKWIEKSPFIKRDYKKVIALAEVVTILNNQHRQIYLEGDERFLITHPEDIIILYQIIEDYMASIQLNLPRSALEMYEFLKENYAEDTSSFRVSDVQATMDKAGTNTSRILYELKRRGLLEVVDKDGKGNIYKVRKKLELAKVDIGDFHITPRMERTLKYEHGPELLAILEDQLQNISDLNIHTWCSPDYIPPEWEFYEPRKEVKSVKLAGLLDKNDIEEEIEEEPESDLEEDLSDEAVSAAGEEFKDL